MLPLTQSFSVVHLVTPVVDHVFCEEEFRLGRTALGIFPAAGDQGREQYDAPIWAIVFELLDRDIREDSCIGERGKTSSSLAASVDK
jgi:hypothetical protein